MVKVTLEEAMKPTGRVEALGGGGWSTPCHGRFAPRMIRWATGSVWTGAENLAPSPEFDPQTMQPVGRRTDYASLAHARCSTGLKRVV